MRAWQRCSRWLPQALGIIVLAAIFFGLHRELAKISLTQIRAALGDTPRPRLLHALLFTSASLCIMCAYDVPGILFAKKEAKYPPLGARRIALASGCAYALSHVLGAAALTSAAIRVRLYAQWAVPPAGIARIVALSAVTFTLGAVTLLGFILLLFPADVKLFGPGLPTTALRALGAAVWLVPAGYIAAAGSPKPFAIRGRTIPRPGPALALAQILLACADTACAGAILYTVLPTAPGVSFAYVLALYLAAFAGGMVSALPGGVGVFDTLLLLGLAGYLDAASALAAILLFRLLYYLLPALIAGAAYAGHEVYLGLRQERRGNAGE